MAISVARRASQVHDVPIGGMGWVGREANQPINTLIRSATPKYLSIAVRFARANLDSCNCHARLPSWLMSERSLADFRKVGKRPSNVDVRRCSGIFGLVNTGCSNALSAYGFHRRYLRPEPQSGEVAQQPQAAELDNQPLAALHCAGWPTFQPRAIPRS